MCSAYPFVFSFLLVMTTEPKEAAAVPKTWPRQQQRNGLVLIPRYSDVSALCSLQSSKDAGKDASQLNWAWACNLQSFTCCSCPILFALLYFRCSFVVIKFICLDETQWKTIAKKKNKKMCWKISFCSPILARNKNWFTQPLSAVVDQCHIYVLISDL